MRPDLMRKPRPARRAGLALLIGLTAAVGCAGSIRQPVGSYERAVEYHARGKHRDAVAAVDLFLRRSPADTLAAPAQRLKALSLMALKEHPLAAVELQILRTEYPGSEFSNEALFLEGLCHLAQVGRVQRDVSEALTARNCFRRFLAAAGDAPQAAEARRRLAEIGDLMLRKKLGEARVYEQLGQPGAGAVILGAALEQESDATLRPQAMLRQAELAWKAGRREEAAATWQKLAADYPDAPEAATARRRLAGSAAAGP